MSINLVTYANQTVTPTNDAIIYEKAVDQNGIFYGCDVTVTSNTVNITGGYGLVCGREFVINSEAISVTLAPSGTLQGRLYVRLDLADADAPIQLLTVTGNTLPALVQDDDVNYTNGVWEMELATFTVGISSLSDVVITYETIDGRKTAIENGINEHFNYIQKSSSKSVANATVTQLETLELGDGNWLVLGDVVIQVGGSQNSVLQSRLVYDSMTYTRRDAGDTSIHVQSIISVEGGKTLTFETFQTTGATKTVIYVLTAIRV